ncbi:DUF6702 domain-containing protein [Flavobacterium branchiophilum]|uniref:Peptidase E n=1 Tax=Flavobacterium branchiophilum (strain FL-15) TaxID=1034807 RepID=G2YZZ5_FLABF|nr:DUF6702 family protein [Flavobacterium branchiophilum]CCB69256.1 Protein of unknown function [Flavobacterium branchiophilum FL-15]
MNKKKILIIITASLLLCFNMHKFYVSMYQINFVPQKKQVQITCRLFIDDLNEVLYKKHHIKTLIGDTSETKEASVLLKNYLFENIKITINGTPKNMVFHLKEIEDDVLICYLKIVDIQTIKKIEIENKSFLELHPDQQNIIQTQINNQKKTLLFTNTYFKEVIKY